MEEKTALIEWINDNLFSPNDLSNYLEIFDLLPFSMYWKNRDGVYLGINRYATEQLVFQQITDSDNPNYVVNKTDHELFEKKTADQYYENDMITLKKDKTSQHFVEILNLPNGESIEQVSVKRSILDENCEPIGVLGCTININKFI